MKRRMLALLTICVLAFSMSLTAFAKPSPEGGRIQFFDKDGNELELDKLEEEEWNNSKECDHGEGCSGVIELITPVIKEFRDEIESLKINDLKKGNYVKVFEAYAHGKGCVKWPVSIKIDAKDWTEGNPVIAFFDTEANKWVLLNYEIKDGYFVLDPISQSGPLVFFLEKDAAAGEESPKTGDPLSLAAVTFAIGAAGVLAFSKKKEEK